ncbi:MAG: hypothetical protein H6862_07370 [Rhodospirillales bacterium]|nr:hypothetical protein [Rhodospirillales bacterium]
MTQAPGVFRLLRLQHLTLHRVTAEVLRKRPKENKEIANTKHLQHQKHRQSQ